MVNLSSTPSRSRKLFSTGQLTQPSTTCVHCVQTVQLCTRKNGKIIYTIEITQKEQKKLKSLIIKKCNINSSDNIFVS